MSLYVNVITCYFDDTIQQKKKSILILKKIVKQLTGGALIKSYPKVRQCNSSTKKKVRQCKLSHKKQHAMEVEEMTTNNSVYSISIHWRTKEKFIY